ncbi:hypothetical protein EJ07DRAFT_160404 [Lizonia empirigonia]|nr:hypothetical protein EJ07DRAFT_160404 [Lizonia empirigonia]
MSTEIGHSVPASATSSIEVTKFRQDNKGKGKGKGKHKIEEANGKDRKTTDVPAEDSKSQALRRTEGKGLEEVDSDSPHAKDGEDDVIDESELSSHVDSDTDADADEEMIIARDRKRKAAKEGRRAARGQEYYDKRDAADSRQAAATANEGFSNYMKKRSDRALPERRPGEVEKQWRGLYHVLKLQWIEGGREKLTGPRLEIIKRANERIERYCDQILNVDVEFNTKANALYLAKLKRLEKELSGEPESHKMLRRKQLHTHCVKEAGQPSKEELLKKWKFPADELCAQIYAIEKALKVLDEMPSEEAYNKKIADYKRRLAASQPNSKEFVDLTNKKTHKEKSLASRKIKTEKLLQTALIFLDNLEEKGIPPTQVLSDRARNVFQDFVSLSRENLKLYNALKEELERPTLEQLDEWDTATQPIYDLVSCVDKQNMATEQSIARASDLVKKLEEIDKSIAVLGKESAGDNSLPLSILNEMLGQYKEGHYEQVEVNVTRLIEQLRCQEAAVGLVRAIEFGQPPSGSTPDPKTTAKPGVHAATADASAEVSPKTTAETTRTRGIGAPVIAGTNLSEDMLREVDITSLKFGGNEKQMFQYDDGMTEHGPLVATRVGTTENARFNRYFVNAGVGVPGMEYLKVIRGSDLAPGGAEKLADQKVVDFDLKQRKKDIKGNHPILKIGPVVLLPRAEGYVRRETKERRQDAYIKVVYKDKPNPDMLCRTQFTQLAGKRFGETQFSMMETTYRQRQVYFEACKVQKLHPQTQKPLTTEDLRKTPWLFPENERDDFEIGSSNSSRESEEDDDEDLLRGVKVDTGALPADITDPFKKPRTGLTDVSDAPPGSQL